jgi:hypothetical protein
MLTNRRCRCFFFFYRGHCVPRTRTNEMRQCGIGAGGAFDSPSGCTSTWDTTSQPRKGDVTGCQFGALGACPVVPGGRAHPTGWWGHPNHRQLPREVPGTRGPTTARHIRCLRGMREARGRSPPPPPLHPRAPCNNPLGPSCAAGGAPGGPTRPRSRCGLPG